MSPAPDRPIRIALCDDQALVLRGLSSLLSDIGNQLFRPYGFEERMGQVRPQARPMRPPMGAAPAPAPASAQTDARPHPPVPRCPVRPRPPGR